MRRLSPLLFLLASLASCADEAPRPYGRPGGGGGGGGGGGRSDAMPSQPDAQDGARISGRLCLVDDMREPLACDASTALADITIVVLGSGASTTTASDGSFSLPSPGGTDAILKIAEGADGFRDVLSPIKLVDDAALNLELPAIPDLTWQSLLNDVGLIEPDASASIATYLVKDGLPLADAEITPPVGTVSAPVYDGPNDPNDWSSGGLTGTRGACIMVGVPSVESSVSFEVSGSALLSASGVPVLPGFLSFIAISVN